MRLDGTKFSCLAVCTGLAACCAVIYGQTLSHGFLSYDDGLYVFENARVKAGLNWGNILWAFTTQSANYVHPLTWMSHMLDCDLYGLRPWGPHLTNLLFHTADTVLLFLVLARMTRRLWPSALVAALFAVHPLHVESVAWIAERKGLLSTLFWVAALGAYAWYGRRPNPARYLAVAFLFLLGLMSKPMVVTLPFVLLLLDWWPLDRIDRADSSGVLVRRTTLLAVEKLPLFLLSAFFCATTFVMQAHGRNLSFGEKIPFVGRCANAVVVYVVYLLKTVWPSGLAVYYPHPLERPLWQVAGAALVLAAITLLCIYHVRRRPYLAVGWFWYLGTLLPVIQLVQIGTFSHADRYTYIPLIGIFVMVAWSLDELRSAGRRHSQAVTAAAALAVAVLGLVAYRQTGFWKDDLALFGHDLAVTGDNSVAHDNIGAALVDQGKPKEAVEQYRLALKGNPDDAEALYNMGVVMELLNRPLEAESWYWQTLRSKPGHAKAHNNLAGILLQSRKFDEALAHYQEAVELAPDFLDARNNLGNLLATQGRLDEAVQQYARALELDPAQTSVRLNLARILVHQGRRDEALQHLKYVLRREPGNKNVQKMITQMDTVQTDSSAAAVPAQ